MKKNFTAILLALITLISCCSSALALTLEYNGEQHEYTGNLYTLYVSGKKVETPLEPIIFNDRAVVPVREVFEALGAEVGYEQATKEVTIQIDNDTVVLTIDENTAYVNDTAVSIPDGVTPMLIAKTGESAKTMVPVRFVSENLGLKVGFNATQKAISVSRPEPAATQTPTEEPKVKLTDVGIKKSGDSVTITVKANGKIDSMTKPILTSSNVLYVDIPQADYATKNSYTVNAGGVTAVRFGRHDTYARIALDLSGCASYDISLAADKKSVVITATAGADSAQTSTQTPIKPTANPDSAEEKIVVIDAGHGGSDPGAIGYYQGTRYNEKDLTLSIAKKVEALLTAQGISVIMTRSGDVFPTLDERPALANQMNAALFVSIHINSAETSAAAGSEIYYSNSNNGDAYGVTSKELAQAISKEVVGLTGQKNRGVKAENFLVIRKSNMPAVLLEVGFISNETELGNMISDSFQQKVAQGVANGILNVWDDVIFPPQTEEIPEETNIESEETTNE